MVVKTLKIFFYHEAKSSLCLSLSLKFLESFVKFLSVSFFVEGGGWWDDDGKEAETRNVKMGNRKDKKESGVIWKSDINNG